jgi:hypothetical protein
MKPKDIELILIEGLYQTPETIVDFYLSKTKENNCTSVNFCLALFEAYKRLEKYVNSFDYSTWAESKDGTKEFIKNTINLLYFTNNKYIGTLDDENIIELIPGLSEMAKQVMQDEKVKMIELFNKLKVPGQGIKTGFQSNLTDEQIQKLFDQFKGRYIDIKTNPDHFKAIFKPDPLTPGFITVKRTKQLTGTLLAYLVSELFQKENQSDYWYVAKNCFDKAKNLKQLFRNAYEYNPGRKPKGYQDIDTILKNIYHPLQ